MKIILEWIGKEYRNNVGEGVSFWDVFAGFVVVAICFTVVVLGVML